MCSVLEIEKGEALRPKPLESKEIEEFKSKLEMDLVSNIKIKPNFSEDWINGLRKRLRDRTTLKSI